MEAGLSKIPVLWEWTALKKGGVSEGREAGGSQSCCSILCSNFLGDLGTLGGKTAIQVSPIFLYLQETEL